MNQVHQQAEFEPDYNRTFEHLTVPKLTISFAANGKHCYVLFVDEFRSLAASNY